MKHCGRRFSALLLTFSLLFSLPLTPVLAEEPLPEEAESEYEAVSLPAADAAEEGTPDADLPEEVPPFAEEPLSPEEETPEESGENALPPAEELPAEETEVPEEAQLPEELPEEDFDPFAYEAEEPLASYYSSNIDQPNDGSSILIYPQLQGGMMLVGQPAFFSLVNWGPGSYEYNFHLLYRAPSEGSEYYNGTVGSWSFVYHSGVQESSSFTYTPELSGVYCLSATVTDKDSGRSGIAYPAEIGGQRVIRLPDLGSGTLSCGLSWVLDAKGELPLRGSGALLCEADGSYPWDALRGEIRSLRTEEGVSSLGASAFEGCRALRSVTLGEDVRELGARALAGTAVEALRLPAGLCSPDPTALEDCSALQTLQAAEDSEFFSSVDGVLYDRAQQQLLLSLPDAPARSPSPPPCVGWAALSASVPSSAAYPFHRRNPVSEA